MIKRLVLLVSLLSFSSSVFAASSVLATRTGEVDLSVVGDYVVAYDSGYCGVTVYGADNRAVWSSVEMLPEYSRFYGAVYSPQAESIAMWAKDDRDQFILVFDVAGDIIRQYGPFEECGYPDYDDGGVLWYTADGYLYRDDECYGLGIDSATISVSTDGGVTYTDTSDRIIRVDNATGVSEEISDERRFYAPAFISSDTIIAPSLEGEIWVFDTYGGRLLVHGSHPSYCPEPEGILFVVSEDGGEKVTSSDIWFVTLDGTKRRITNTPSILEAHPAYWRGDIVATDESMTGLQFVEEGW